MLSRQCHLNREYVKVKGWCRDNERIDQLDSFPNIGSIISKDGGCIEDVKSRIAKV